MDHIADFLKFISSAQSYWFSLDTSYDHCCHLANPFRLYPEEYEALLIVAGLVSYIRSGFQIKATASLLSHCLSLFSHHATHSSSHCAGWLLHRLLTRHPLIMLPLVVSLCQLVVASSSLVVLSLHCPLVPANVAEWLDRCLK